MSVPSHNDWEIVAGATTVAAVAAFAAWLILRKRPSPEEVERGRRQFLVESGRLVDGMLLDAYNVEGAAGQSLSFLLFSYRIGGVNYECSQEVTSLHGLVEVSEVRPGLPCTVRYQPGNPHNSIVIAEGWTGIRACLPQFPAFDDPNPLDTSHLER
jgi:hypothetical protein